MNKKILEFLKKPYALFVWALLCGCAYLTVVAQLVMQFTNTAEGGKLLLWFFVPAIVCGGALIIIKTIKVHQQNENTKGILTIFYSHLLIIAMGIVFFISMFV